MHPYTHWLFNNLRLFNYQQLKTERTERTLALIEDEIALLKEVLCWVIRTTWRGIKKFAWKFKVN